MINKIKIKLYLATIPILFGLECQTVSAVETLTKEFPPTSQTFISVQPSRAFPPDSENLTPQDSLITLLKTLQQFSHQPLPTVKTDDDSQAKWVEALTADIDTRSAEIKTLIHKIEDLTADIKEAEKQKTDESSSKETHLRSQQQEALGMLILLQEIQKLESNIRYRNSESASYKSVADFFGDSVLGKIAAAPALFGASLFMPLFTGNSSPEESKCVRKDSSGKLFLGKTSEGSNPIDDMVSALLVGGTMAVNYNFIASPYLYASLLVGGCYQGGKATRQYVRQIANGLWGKSMSSQQIETLAGAAALLYFAMNIPSVQAFPYAAPGTEVQLDSRTNLGVASLTSGNSLFVAMADTTSVNGKFYDSTSLASTSALYSISQTPVATANIPSAIISNSTYFVGYTLSANGGDIALRAGNATGFFGPEVSIMPNVGAQSGVSLIDLQNGYFAALLNTNPLGSNSDVVGYTFNTTLGVVKGPYPINTVTTGNQFGPSGGVFSNGKLGVTFTGDQSGTATQYSVVLDPMTGTNIVPDFPLKAPQSGVKQGHGMCAELKGGNLACIYIDGGNLREAVVDASGSVICNVQVNDAAVSSLNPNTTPFISGTGDGNSIVQYTALPAIPGNYRVYYAVVTPLCDVLSKDTIIPKSNNGQTAAGVQALQNNDFIAIFSGSSQTQPGLIGTRIANTGSTATVLPTTTRSTSTPPTTRPSSASSLQPIFSTWLSAIMSTARTATLDPSMMSTSVELTTFNGDVHSAGGALMNPFGVVYYTIQGVAGWGMNTLRWFYQ